jgi:hypothetical protein
MQCSGTSGLRGFLPVIVAVALAACGDDDKRSSQSTGAQACKDVADAVANAAVRCNLGTYQQNFDGFVQAAANGNCNNIVQVRDEKALYDTCIPAIETMNCTDLQSANLDASCRSQLLRQQ